MPFAHADSLELLFSLSAVCLAISVIISALEYIAMLGEFRQGGAFCWRFVDMDMRDAGVGRSSSLRRTLLGSRSVAMLLAVRAVSGCTLLVLSGVGAKSPVPTVTALACILATGAILHYRCTFGLEGGDLMSMIVSAGLLVAALPGSQHVWPVLGLGFIAAESCLSYLTSGAAKLASPPWRSGRALYGILRTGTFGYRPAARLLRDRPRLSLLLCWGVMIFEVAFPLLLLLPFKVMIGGLAIGAAFHICNAYIMGLNTFCWAFLATYPGLLYCHGQLRALFG